MQDLSLLNDIREIRKEKVKTSLINNEKHYEEKESITILYNQEGNIDGDGDKTFVMRCWFFVLIVIVIMVVNVFLFLYFSLPLLIVSFCIGGSILIIIVSSVALKLPIITDFAERIFLCNKIKIPESDDTKP